MAEASEPQSKHRQYVYKMYEAMFKLRLERINDSGESINIYQGYTTHLLEQLHLPKSHWTSVMKRLVLIGAIECSIRGNTIVQSEYILWSHPSTFSEGWTAKDLTRDRKPGTLEQQIKDIRKSLGGLNIEQALVDITNRLERLEKVLQPETGE